MSLSRASRQENVDGETKSAHNQVSKEMDAVMDYLDKLKPQCETKVSDFSTGVFFLLAIRSVVPFSVATLRHSISWDAHYEEYVQARGR